VSVILRSGLVAAALAVASVPLGAQAGPPSTANTGRYRITITGFVASKATVDDPRDYDGVRDEVYAASAFVIWDRRTQAVLDRGVTRTREYGDVGNAGKRGTRIQAGSATVTGGIWTSKGDDVVPREFDPRGTELPAASPDQFPLLIWEGTLTDGVEGVLLVPSLWESDLQPRSYDNYHANWKSSPVGFLSTPVIQKQLGTPTITSAVIAKNPAAPVAKALTTMFTGGLVGSFSLSSMLTAANVDRPIGLTPAGSSADYQERLVVVTREKLAGLMPGTGMTVAVPFAEPADGVLDGSYTLYLRLDRIQ
jgi:hypothetical protein